jgi:hypothetical protein
MTTAADVGAWIKIGIEAGTWLAGMIARFVAGDDSEPVRRVIDVLPSQMRADVEHERQRELLRAELVGDLATTARALPVLEEARSIREAIARHLPAVDAPRLDRIVADVIASRPTEPPPQPFDP